MACVSDPRYFLSSQSSQFLHSLESPRGSPRESLCRNAQRFCQLQFVGPCVWWLSVQSLSREHNALPSVSFCDMHGFSVLCRVRTSIVRFSGYRHRMFVCIVSKAFVSSKPTVDCARDAMDTCVALSRLALTSCSESVSKATLI